MALHSKSVVIYQRVEPVALLLCSRCRVVELVFEFFPHLLLHSFLPKVKIERRGWSVNWPLVKV